VDDLLLVGREKREDDRVETDVDAEHIAGRTNCRAVKVGPEAAETLGKYRDVPD